MPLRHRHAGLGKAGRDRHRCGLLREIHCVLARPRARSFRSLRASIAPISPTYMKCWITSSISFSHRMASCTGFVTSDAWGQIIARFLKPGGIFYIVEDHPFFRRTAGRRGGRMKAERPYFFSEAPEQLETSGSYATDNHGKTRPTTSGITALARYWNALIDAGLTIEFLHEFPYAARAKFPFMEQGPDGWWRLPEGMTHPLLVFAPRSEAIRIVQYPDYSMPASVQDSLIRLENTQCSSGIAHSMTLGVTSKRCGASCNRTTPTGETISSGASPGWATGNMASGTRRSISRPSSGITLISGWTASTGLLGFVLSEDGANIYFIFTAHGHAYLYDEILDWTIAHWGTRYSTLACEVHEHPERSVAALESQRLPFNRGASPSPASTTWPPSARTGEPV